MTQALCDQAKTLHQQGRLAEAGKLYLQILAREPDAPTPLHLLGILRLQQGRNDEALALIGKALEQTPGDAEIRVTYGNALKQLGRSEDALDSFASALAADPAYAGAAYNRAILLQDLGRFEEALKNYAAAIAIQPGFVQALFDCALLLQSLARREEALAAYDQLLAHHPRFSEGWNNRAVLLQELQRPEEALESLARALAINPSAAEAILNRGVSLNRLRRHGEALEAFERGLTLQPAAYPKGWCNYAILLQDMKRYREAFAAFSKALDIDPGNAEVLHLRGKLAWTEFRDYETARRDLDQAAALEPARPYLPGDLAYLKMQVCDWQGREDDIARIDAGVRSAEPVVEPFIYQAISESPADLKACSLHYAARHFPAFAPLHRMGARRPGRIRIGYVSGEFKEQATAYLMAGLYESHDRSQFEIFAFDNGGGDDSAMRARLEAAIETFVDIRSLSDLVAAQRIAQSDIDILVNLNGYFGERRTGIFAHRPAPIQVNYLGFPATLGAPYIDYILADACVIPPSERQFYTEQIVTLPGSYQVTDDARPIAAETPSRAQCGLPDDAFVFCSFNQSYKISPDCFSGWMRILQHCPGSVLWLLDNGAQMAANLRGSAKAAGIAPERLVFAPVMAVQQHLARLKLGDLCLDTLPYNAHTTASDALWAGLPLLTRRGTAFPGRVGASLLMAVGLPELVTEDQQAYETLAIALAHAPDRLRALKENLALGRDEGALFDTERFRQQLEWAYRRMLEREQQSLAPQAFNVPAL